MGYKFDLGNWNGIFAVPKCVAEEHIKLAKEDFIKVLLILLANSGSEISEEEISQKSGVTLSNIPDAINFWIEKKVISACDNVLSPADEIKEEISVEKHTEEKIKSPLEKIIASDKETTVKTDKNLSIKSKEPLRLTGYELSKRINTADELKWLISETEKMFGRFLNQVEISTIVSMFDYASLPADIIVMIIEYCVSIDKINIRFIEKTAYSWIDEGYDNHQKIEEHITKLNRERESQSIIKQLFGIYDHNLSSKQKEYASVWLDKWKFSTEMIKLAYEKCIDNTNKVDFRYINKILSSWFEKGLTTAKEVEENENTRQEQKTSETTFNAQEFDNMDDYVVPDLKNKSKGKKQ